MSTISATGNAQASNSTAVKKTGALQELGKDVFLQLMVTQLRFQDPLNPQDNSAFVAQMAQFTSLEQLQNLNVTVAKLLELQSGVMNPAPSLLGLMVTASGSDGRPVSGQVTAVEYTGGRPQLVVNGQRLPLENVTTVTAGGE